MKSIYIDSLFLISLIIDYLLCLVTGRFCALTLRRRRYVLAALFGAVYSVCVFLPRMSFLALPVMELACAFFMGLIAFGCEARLLRCVGVFLAVSATFGGAVWTLTLHGEGLVLDPVLLVLLFFLCYGFLSLVSRMKNHKAAQGLCTVELRLNGRAVRFPGLRDTGNCLCDPYSGAPVLIAAPGALAALFGEYSALLELDGVELVSALESLPACPVRLRLISYSSIGGGGLLPVFRPDKVKLDGEERPGLVVGISPAAAGDGFQAIVP